MKQYLNESMSQGFGFIIADRNGKWANPYNVKLDFTLYIQIISSTNENISGIVSL